MKRLNLLLILVFMLSLVASAQTAPDFSNVEKTLGRAGKFADGVYKVGFPRTDLSVKIGATQVYPAAGLGSWMAFRKDEGTNFVADGDLVLLAAEVNPAISALQDGGIEVSAVHNHLIGEEPQVMYVHFFGRAPLEKLTAALHNALAATKTPTAPPPPAPAVPLAGKKEIEAAMGKPGAENGSVLAFAFPRTNMIAMHQATLAPSMGMATAINFQPSPKGVAATGDFVLRESEVAGVMASLRKDGILVTALHNHLLDDEPRMVFMHFWAEGKPADVAAALRRALDVMTK